MKKNSDKNIQSIQIDPITGNYYITIPEWMINELSWYEDTEVLINLEGTDLIISENN
jgi:hypothetical protein